MKRPVVPLLIVFFLLSSRSFAFTATGFSNPYGVVVDPTTRFVYISNMNGGPLDQDANGFISRLKSDGVVDQLRFIDGARRGVILNAPKGMEIVGQKLYVADLDTIRVFDLTSGKPLSDLKLPSITPQHIYDLAIGPDGALYATDVAASAIYRIDLAMGGAATTFLSGDTLGGPHALFFDAGRQLFVMSMWEKGKLLAYDRAGKYTQTPGVFIRTIEGVAADDRGNLYFSSGALRSIYRLDMNFALQGFALDLANPAGLAYDTVGKAIIAVQSDTNTVTSYPLGESK